MSEPPKRKRGDGTRQRSRSLDKHKKELSLLRSLWRLLGWSDLHREQHSFARLSSGRNSDETFTWYETGDLDDVYLIVNRSPGIGALPFMPSVSASFQDGMNLICPPTGRLRKPKQIGFRLGWSVAGL